MRIKLEGFDDMNYLRGGFLLSFIRKHKDLEEVEQSPDVVLINVLKFGNDIEKNEFIFRKYEGKKKIIFSGENLFTDVLDWKYKNAFAWFIFRLCRRFGPDFGIYCTDILDRFFGRSVVIGMRNAFVLDKIRHDETVYGILSNKAVNDRTITFPYGFDTHLNKLPELLLTKKENRYISKKKKFCAFIAANSSATDRIDFFHLLSKYKKVDSLGKVLNNTAWDKSIIQKHRLAIKSNHNPSFFEQKVSLKYNRYSTDILSLNQELFQEYKFVICFENTYEHDYFTEKLLNAMMANSIAIYRGAPNISEYFNTSSFIDYNDCGQSYEEMIKQIIYLDQNDEAYLEFIKRPFFKNDAVPESMDTAHQKLDDFFSCIISKPKK